MRRCACLLALIVAGCGGKSSSFVGSTSDSVVYVTWKRSDKSLKGELSRATVPGGTQRVAFTGTADGSAVNLRLERAVGARTTLSGALAGDTLTLDNPGQGGTSTIRLRAAGEDDFMQGTAALRGRAAQEQAAPVTTPAPTTAKPGTDAKLDAVRAAYEQVRTDETLNYTDTICDDVSTLHAAVDELRRAGASAKAAREARSLQAKADAACRRANGGNGPR
jgi:hypothetical protein